MPPLDPDWYYVRAASIIRRIYLNGGIGVGALARWYGQATSTKSRPEHFVRAARGLIRHILRNLQACGLVEETDKGGRRVTAEGQKVRAGASAQARGRGGTRSGGQPHLTRPSPPPYPPCVHAGGGHDCAQRGRVKRRGRGRSGRWRAAAPL